MRKKYKLVEKNKKTDFEDLFEIFEKKTKTFIKSERVFESINPYNHKHGFWSRDIVIEDELENQNLQGKNALKKIQREKSHLSTFKRAKVNSSISESDISDSLSRRSSKIREKISDIKLTSLKKRRQRDISNLHQIVFSGAKASLAQKNFQGKKNFLPSTDQKGSPISIKESSVREKSEEKLEMVRNLENEQNFKTEILELDRLKKKKKGGERVGKFKMSEKSQEIHDRFFRHRSLKNRETMLTEAMIVEKEYRKTSGPLLKQIEEASKFLKSQNRKVRGFLFMFRNCLMFFGFWNFLRRFFLRGFFLRVFFLLNF